MFARLFPLLAVAWLLFGPVAHAQSAQTPHPHISTQPDVLVPTQALSGDLDGDGDADVVVFSDVEVTWFENQLDEAASDFVARGAVSPNLSADGGALGDLNNDGVPDVIVVDFSQVVVAVNNGTGTFSVDIVLYPADQGGLVSPRLADVDRDGDLDLFLFDGRSGRVLQFLNLLVETGSLSFREPEWMSPSPDNQVVLGGASLQVQRVDGDAYPDLVYMDGTELVWRRNLRPASPGFGEAQSIATVGEHEGHDAHVRLHDLSGDGALDILQYSTVDHRLQVFSNATATGQGFSRSLIAADVYHHFDVADVNRDGLPDVLITTSPLQPGARYRWVENTSRNGTITFGPAEDLYDVPSIASGIATARLDGDAYDDILTVDAFSHRVSYVLDEDLSSLPLSAPPSTVNRPPDVLSLRQLRTADFNGDGSPEVVALDQSFDRVVWYENRIRTPAAEFGSQQILVEGGGLSDVDVADVDGDGRIDVIVAAAGLTWYRNTSSGSAISFAPAQPVSTTRAVTVETADLDGDGDVDFFGTELPPLSQPPDYSVQNERRRYVVETITPGPAPKFSAPLILATNRASHTIALDVDLDGDLDLVGLQSGARNSLPLLLYRNISNGALSFTDGVVQHTLQHRPYDLAVSDFDGDGFSDVLVATDVSLDLYRNDGTPAGGLMAAEVLDGAYDNRYTIEVVDVDHDGKPDVLTGTSLGVHVLSNASRPGIPRVRARKSIADQGDLSEAWTLAADYVDADDRIDLIIGSGYSSGRGTRLLSVPLGGLTWLRNEAEVTLGVDLTVASIQQSTGQIAIRWSMDADARETSIGVERSVNHGAFFASPALLTTTTIVAAETVRSGFLLTDDAIPFDARSVAYRLSLVDTDGSARRVGTIRAVIDPPTQVVLNPPFPNPSSSQATFQIAVSPSTPAEITVYNILGQLVARPMSVPNLDGRIELTLPVDRLASGLYFVRLRAGTEVRTQRLTVVH